jgi:chemotaxis protein CheD
MMPQPDPARAAVPVEVYVQPGESHLVTEPSVLRTVLGSCVGVAFWAPRLGAAALCHPMLPRVPDKTKSNMSLTSGRRYVDFAIRDLAAQFDRLGLRRNEVQVKLFGGGDVLLMVNDASRPTVGKLNYEMAIRVLRDEGFDVVASSLGGTSGLHIQFNSVTGEVLRRRLN